MTNQRPVVLVHGMFGFGGQELGEFNYWGSALQVQSPLPLIEASVGPISSAHDRACELAAQLKGGQVDYGEVHADAQGHARFGRTYERPLWPDWSAKKPLHMVGHSLGATTIRALHDLLAGDYWGWGSSNQWIASVSSISGPLNGTTAIIYFGADPQTGLLRRKSGISAVLQLIDLYTGLGDKILDSVYDFDLDHWGYERRADEDLISYLRRVGGSNFYWGPDNAFHSVSLQCAYRDNARWTTFPQAYYFAYVTDHTFHLRPGGAYYSSPLMNAALQPVAWNMGRMTFNKSPIPDKNFKSSDWWPNDGLVPTYSQTHPRYGRSHPSGGVITAKTAGSEFSPGQWYTQWERGLDHAAICMAPRFWQRGRQQKFYENLYQRLAALKV
ncbi:MAG: esterase/lipase family protein [Candidatus Promineifilaceae bacterium]